MRTLGYAFFSTLQKVLTKIFHPKKVTTKFLTPKKSSDCKFQTPKRSSSLPVTIIPYNRSKKRSQKMTRLSFKSEIWYNKNDFEIIFTRDDKKAKKCESSTVEFAGVQQDIAVRHIKN